MQKFISSVFILMVHFTTCNAQSNMPAKHTNSFNFKQSCLLLANSSSFKYKFSPPYGERGKAYYQEKLRKAKALKIAGIVMASVGGCALAGTIAGTVYLVRNRIKLSDGGVADVYKIYGTAVGGTGLSVGLIASGIPLSISGSKKAKKYKKIIAENNY